MSAVFAKIQFNQYDIDNNGTISAAELEKALHESYLQLDARGIDKEQIQAIIARADVNGDAGIQFSEFATLLKEIQSAKKISDIEDLGLLNTFNNFDGNHDGVIDRKELDLALEHVWGNHIKDKDVEALFSNYDEDASGSIDLKEFRRLHHEIINVLTEKYGPLVEQIRAEVHCRAVFTIWDTDKNGHLDLKETSEALAGWWDRPLELFEQQKLKQLFKECDADGNGTIEVDEFKELHTKLEDWLRVFKEHGTFASEQESSSGVMWFFGGVALASIAAAGFILFRSKDKK